MSISLSIALNVDSTPNQSRYRFLSKSVECAINDVLSALASRWDVVQCFENECFCKNECFRSVVYRLNSLSPIRCLCSLCKQVMAENECLCLISIRFSVVHGIDSNLNRFGCRFVSHSMEHTLSEMLSPFRRNARSTDVLASVRWSA